jgi:meiotic recombination protein REC8, fungi type
VTDSYRQDPGQGRRVSRPPSALGSHLGYDVGTQNALDGSQRSSLFPWDNAGVSSSMTGAALNPPGEENDRGSVDRAEVKLRSLDSPFSRRESAYTASQIGSATGKIGFSPMALGNDAELVGEDFAFDGEISSVLSILV